MLLAELSPYDLRRTQHDQAGRSHDVIHDPAKQADAQAQEGLFGAILGTAQPED